MSERVDEAFKSIRRSDFLPPESSDEAHLDRPIIIGYSQTNSQPSTVRAMLEWLEVEPGQTVLDVGSGSGWTTALLATLVGEQGHVTAVEIIASLLEFGKTNCQKYGFTNIAFHKATQEIGWEESAPYDRILVSASANNLPTALLAQLAPKGKMVIPVVNEIIEITKGEDGTLYKTAHTGYAFVPLISSSAD